MLKCKGKYLKNRSRIFNFQTSIGIFWDENNKDINLLKRIRREKNRENIRQYGRNESKQIGHPGKWTTVKVNMAQSCPALVTPWTVQSMEFSRPEYWSGYPFLSPGDLPNLGIEPRSSTLQAHSLPAKPQGNPKLSGKRWFSDWIQIL